MTYLKANISHMRETSKDARRDNGFMQEIAAIHPSTGNVAVRARIYMPGTVAHCSIWITGNNSYGRGQGRAGGGGYHKPSAALQDAISDAGVTLHGDVYARDKSDKSRAYIDGVGESAMDAAIEAIARAVTGKRKFIIHKAHG